MSEEKKLSLLDVLKRGEEQYAGALPAFMSGQIERVLTVLASTVRNSPALSKCSLGSLQQCAMMSAQTGLLVDGVLGQAYLVPFGGDAVFMPGYKGLLKLARNSGVVQRVEAHIVYHGDEFSLAYGDKPHLDHIPCSVAARGDVYGAYAVAFFQGSGSQFHWMEEAELVEARDRFSSGHRRARQKGKKSTWDEHPVAMRLKTVARGLCKWLPTDYEPLQRAVGLDEQHEADVRVPDYEVDGEPGEDFTWDDLETEDQGEVIDVPEEDTPF